MNQIQLFWLRSSRNRVSKGSFKLGRGKPVTLVAYVRESDGVRFSTATAPSHGKFDRREAHRVVLAKLNGNDSKSVKIDESIGERATIVAFIVATSRGRENGPVPRLYEAAYNSYGELVAQHLYKRKMEALSMQKAAALQHVSQYMRETCEVEMGRESALKETRI